MKNSKYSSRYTKEVLEDAVKRNLSVSGVLRTLGCRYVSGGTHSHVSRRIKTLGIDTSHFLGQAINRGAISPHKIRWENRLVVLPDGSNKIRTTMLRRALLESGVFERCVACGIGKEWLAKKLVLEIDHIDGDPLNNRKENLRFLCPNCHSQTETYCGRNIICEPTDEVPVRAPNEDWRRRPRPHKRKVDYSLVISATQTENYNRVAKKFGLSWNGVKKIVDKYDTLSGLV